MNRSNSYEHRLVSDNLNPDKPELNQDLTQRREDAKFSGKYFFFFLCELCGFA